MVFKTKTRSSAPPAALASQECKSGKGAKKMCEVLRIRQRRRKRKSRKRRKKKKKVPDLQLPTAGQASYMIPGKKKGNLKRGKGY
jgi:hypothetical protein